MIDDQGLYTIGQLHALRAQTPDLQGFHRYALFQACRLVAAHNRQKRLYAEALFFLLVWVPRRRSEHLCFSDHADQAWNYKVMQ